MANERQYIDFYVQLRDLDQASGTFKVAVLPSPAVGETREAVTVRYSPGELTPSLQRLNRRELDQESLSQLGEQLAGMLLPLGEVRALFERAISLARQDGGVRLRLLTSEPELAQLPWEYSYLPLYKGANDYRHFLVLNPQISLVRHEPIAKQHPKVEGASSDKLNLLVAMANPTGNLNLEGEKQKLTRVLDGFNVDGVTFQWQPILEDATVQNLSAALMRKPELFYFAGHGHFDQQGSIQLQGATKGSGYAMPATELALKLKQAGVRVAVFGACESAQRDAGSEWAGVAPTLVAEGVPVVVAMQYAILDEHAIGFSEAFYIALAAGLSVDEAVASGRLAMLGADASKTRDISTTPEDENKEQPNQPPANVQWGVPVLYMRSADSVIFPRKESAKAEEIRTLIEQNIGAIRDSRDFVGIDIKEITRSVHIKQDFKEVKNTDGFIGIKIDKL